MLKVQSRLGYGKGDGPTDGEEPCHAPRMMATPQKKGQDLAGSATDGGKATPSKFDGGKAAPFKCDGGRNTPSKVDGGTDTPSKIPSAKSTPIKSPPCKKVKGAGQVANQQPIPEQHEQAEMQVDEVAKETSANGDVVMEDQPKGGLELDHQQTLAAYAGKSSDEKLEIQMQVVKFRDTCHEVAFGQTDERYGALLALLEEAQRGDYCVSCVAGFHLTQRDFQEQQTLSFKLLAQTLPLESARQLLVNALSSRPLLHQAAVNLARLFHEDHEIAASSSQLISGSPYAMELLQRFKVNFKPTLRPYTGARIELAPPRDPLVFAREELASYMAFARALPHNWHYKTCTPVTNGFDLERHLSQEEQRAAAMLMLDLSIVKRRDHWTIVTQNGSSEVVVTLDPCGLFVMEDQRMSEVDLFCGIAEYPHRSAERVRLALECVANLAGKGHRRALAAACWRAGYSDAVVRDAALEVMQRVAEVKDLPEIDDMLQRWWGNDCHAKRVRLEMQRFFGLEVF